MTDNGPILPKGGVNELERIAADAWPASEKQDLDGWTLRADAAPTRRVNSCALWREAPDARPLAARIAAVEAFYRERGRPPRFQVTRESVPAGIDEELAGRGYTVEAPVDIQTVPVTGMTLGDVGAHDIRVIGETPEWHALYQAGYGRDISSILKSLRHPAVCPLGFEDGEPVALTLAVLVDGWVGIFGMLTAERLRGRGWGRAMLGAVHGWAVANGAEGLYLQVEKYNDGARRLYERVGFRTRYSYHYRLLGNPA